MHNTSPPWAEDESERLRALWDAGKTSYQIAIILGRTPGSVIGRVHRMKLTPRPSPIKAATNGPAKPRAPREQRAHGVVIVRKRVNDAWPKHEQADTRTMDTVELETVPIEPKHWFPASAKRDKLPIPVGSYAPARACQWPLTDRRPWAFCGCASVAGYSYCGDHKAQAFRSYVQGEVA